MLDTEHGEVLEGLGSLYRVVPTDKWADTPLFQEAAMAATSKFKAAGKKFVNDGEVMDFARGQVVCQEYPLLDTLVIIFCSKVNGKYMYYWHQFRFEQEMINRMSAEGFWDTSLPVLKIN